MKRVGIIIFVGVLLIFAADRLLPPPSSSPSTPAPPPSTSGSVGSCLVIRESTLHYSNGFSRIQGLAQNECGRDLHRIYLTFRLYAEDGSVIGSAIASQDGLAAQERWR
ncbi:MAG: FxLYD domain-containing protein, partial [Bryobacter sp.]|nr:FxLYD domain-containing protein [Bryobacter sp.]